MPPGWRSWARGLSKRGNARRARDPAGILSSPGKASGHAAQTVVEVGELHRFRFVLHRLQMGPDGLAEQAEILGGKDGAAALRFVRHDMLSCYAAWALNWAASVLSASAVVELAPPATVWAIASK